MFDSVKLALVELLINQNKRLPFAGRLSKLNAIQMNGIFCHMKESKLVTLMYGSDGHLGLVVTEPAPLLFFSHVS